MLCLAVWLCEPSCAPSFAGSLAVLPVPMRGRCAPTLWVSGVPAGALGFGLIFPVRRGP